MRRAIGEHEKRTTVSNRREYAAATTTRTRVVFVPRERAPAREEAYFARDLLAEERRSREKPFSRTRVSRVHSALTSNRGGRNVRFLPPALLLPRRLNFEIGPRRDLSREDHRRKPYASRTTNTPDLLADVPNWTVDSSYANNDYGRIDFIWAIGLRSGCDGSRRLYIVLGELRIEQALQSRTRRRVPVFFLYLDQVSKSILWSATSWN